MRTINPGLPGPSYSCGEEELEHSPNTFQFAKDKAGRVNIVTRWTFTPDERAAIAAGADLFCFTLVDERPQPAVGMVVGPPTLDAEQAP